MMANLTACSWPVSKLSEALEALAYTCGLMPTAIEIPAPPHAPMQGADEALTWWIEAAAGCLGLEAESVDAPYAEVEQLVRRAGPALLRWPGPGELRFLVLLGSRQRAVSILGPDRVVHWLQSEAVRTALCQTIELPLVAAVTRLLDEAGVPKRRQARARTAILRERLSPVRIGGCWLLRPPPGANLWTQVRQARLPHHLVGLIGAHAIQFFLVLLSWWMIGRGAFEGRLDWGWLLAWALLLLTVLPFRLFATWAQGLLALGAGGLLKRRLLYGALRLEPEELRYQGAGQLLGRVIESGAVESLTLSGGFLTLLAGVELIIAAIVLSMGVGGQLHTLLLLGWVALTLLMGWRYFRHFRHWSEARLRMTHDLVEQMVGHRTRLAQEAREHWHDGEDHVLEQYLARSGAMDRAALVQALIPGGWLVLSLLGIAPAFVSGHSSPAALAVSLGGTLAAVRALGKLVAGSSALMGAAIAWQRVAPFFRAATRPEVGGLPTFALALSPHWRQATDRQPVLEAHDLGFRYHEQGEPVLRGCNLQVCAGDRILLEGPSGGGKSTLVSLLSGLRSPQSGLLLFRGLDPQTLGSAGWRQQVVAAPQFHENYVLTGTFAFNLLMGRCWPASPEDLHEAETICRELGLGELLDRMPAGMLQLVGETGWQLSHGERSRLYIARALLQNAALVLLDESFAALDPETFDQALRCVLNRASTVLVIAHP
jgi:ATP-binding cassette subfamily B protein